jgi:hypothetical protein
MKALSLTPCLWASSLDLPMVLVLMRLAHRFLQSGAPLAATKATTLSIMGRELSEEAPGDGAREPFRDALTERLKPLVGLEGCGEKVPWPHGPSWACSRSRASRSRAVVSEGALEWAGRLGGEGSRGVEPPGTSGEGEFEEGLEGKESGLAL